MVYRTRRGKPEYLLVEAKNKTSEWVLPKGHIEEDEQERETAVREVLEETGVWARIVSDLEDVNWSVNGESIATRFFLMKAVGCGLRKDKDRKHKWVGVTKAIELASHSETRKLLEAADEAHKKKDKEE